MTSAIILVGGQGTRLRPLTDTTPKPLLQLGGVPVVSHQFARLAAAGIRDVVLATCYLPEKFHSAFGDGAVVGLAIAYTHEREPLGTGGAIRNAVSGLPDDENVVILNGDILSSSSIAAQIARHREARARATLHIVTVDDPRPYGTVEVDASGLVTAFVEKSEQPPARTINAGCYVFTREAILSIPTGRPVSVERETLPDLVADGAVAAYLEDGYWLDIGTLEAYVQAQEDMANGTYASPALPRTIRAEQN